MSKRSTRHRTRSSQGDIRPFEGRRQVNPHTAGVDIGAHEMMAGVPDGDDQHIVRVFGTYPVDLDALAAWLIDRGIQTVAMESTGVYGMPRFETLEARALHCCLSSAASITHVPGRKSDVLDCQWMQPHSPAPCMRRADRRGLFCDHAPLRARSRSACPRSNPQLPTASVALPQQERACR